jgi:hypothetical protein
MRVRKLHIFYIQVTVWEKALVESIRGRMRVEKIHHDYRRDVMEYRVEIARDTDLEWFTKNFLNQQDDRPPALAAPEEIKPDPDDENIIELTEVV